MTITSLTRRTLFVLTGVFLAASIVGVGVVREQEQQPQKKQRKEWLTSVPFVGSKVKKLEIINARIVGQDTDSPGVAFEIWNKSNRAVMAVEISSGSGSIAKDGLEDEENPTVIIEPHGTLAAEMFGELNPGKPIVITAAVFDDGKEEGQESSLKLMKRVRARQRAVKAHKR